MIGCIDATGEIFHAEMRVMKKMLLAISLIIILTGCTHYYTQPGKTTSDFNRDKQYCQAIGEQEAARKGTRACDETENCLVRKGWRRD